MSNENRMSEPRRAAILSSAGLVGAPKTEQALFWQRYNLERTRRRTPPLLGDLAVVACPDSASVKDGFVRRLDAAWQRVLPAQYAEAAQVEGFRTGRLQVVVDSAAARYVLERQLGGKLLEAINTLLGGNEVARIEYRLGQPTANRKGANGRGMKQRGKKA